MGISLPDFNIEQGTPNDEFRNVAPIIIHHSLIGVRYYTSTTRGGASAFAQVGCA